MDKVRRNQFLFSMMYLLVAMAAMYGFQALMWGEAGPRVVPYSEFLTQLRAGKIVKAEIKEDEIVAVLKGGPAAAKSAEGGAGKVADERAPAPGATATPGGKPSDATSTGTAPRARAGAAPVANMIVAKRLPRVDEGEVVEEMQRQGVVFAGKIERVSWWQSILAGWILPVTLMMVLYVAMLRRVSAKGGPLSVGRNRAKIYDETAHGRVTFDDVAGVDEAKGELVEIVEFLRRPDKYQRLGARIPKGVLLVGPPGTGKTLLAKAVAGEAGAPFFSLSGSEFVEMFVGVGAARIRDLFEQAKERAPCIVFIDELDAIGKSRAGGSPIVTHDEREQTLNQLLVEMDGFESNKGVIIMAATNRPEVLDQALLRPGRFDRQVLVDRPDLRGREEILRVHARKAKMASAVDLRTIAQRTPGMVGADLANVVNEAALAAGRRNSGLVETGDFEEAIDRIQLGLKKKGRVMSEDEKRRVAFHEGGHALVAMSLEHSDPVHRVTIIPRSIGALGATLQLPTEERYLMTRAELLDRICVMMGGRAGEQLVFGEVSTGAQNDLERATETARQMVCRFGMSDRLGAVTLGKPASARFLDGPLSLDGKTYSEETARAIDEEVRALVEGAQERALLLLRRRRMALDGIARALLDRETIERGELETVIATSVDVPLPDDRHLPGISPTTH